MNSSIRTRFAPSPTGDLHVGNLRVAVFNHLLARRHGGAFVVRIEDTDVERNQPEAVERILEDLAWAGLDWDEGPDGRGSFGPYLQSERGEAHRARAYELARMGFAYPCFCSDQDMKAARDAPRTSPGCPGECGSLSPEDAEARRAAGEPRTLRFRVPNDSVDVQDAIRGQISFPGRDIGDFVILRADERATYNFAVVVDDLDMRITHVIRGAGHLSNTPKQALVFDALGAPRPVFAHLPTVLGPDGTKLSKRTGAPGVRELNAAGYHPDAVVNYLSLLGWSPGDDREVFTRSELVQAMDLGRAGASDAVFDPEKLRWMSQQHIATMSLETLTEKVAPYVDRERFPVSAEELPAALDAIRTRLHTFGEVNEHLPTLFPGESALSEGWKTLLDEDPASASLLTEVHRELDEAMDWNADTVGRVVRDTGKALNRKGPALFHPIRLAISGERSGPDLGKVLAALGKARTLDRIDRARRFLVDDHPGPSVA